METTIIQRILGILMFSWYLFSPEIVQIQEGRFTKKIIIKTIIITFLSILISTRLDIKYFINNYPQRATIVFLASIIILLIIYLKYGDILKIKLKLNRIRKIILKKKLKKTSKIILASNTNRLKVIILSYFNKILDWIYFSNSSTILMEVERKAFLYVWNSLRIIILYIMLFEHLIIKFLEPSFGLTFLLLLTLHGVLLMDRIVRKYPARLFIGVILAPWIVYTPMYFICKDIGIKPVFLEDNYLVWFLGLDTSNWFGSTIKFCIFNSLAFLSILIFWIILSLITSYVIKQVITFLRLGLIQLPIFSELKKNTIK
jgi:hypothetical protein